ncbi:uncharacterized protein LOC110103831 [Dendrobium catenatum]|uniref:uncharacterized protein LOC110103831 n=1 Tax=Dendrobium catenatum TaxID=906689 RepID=UPI0009F3B2C8|nr:uncharacterized protein LOC110103831 [Dendrobium catenatum]
METITRQDIDRLVGRHWDFCYQPSVGRAGGILVLWKGAIGAFQVLFQSNQCIMGTMNRSNTVGWEIAMVYANNDRYVRRQLWEDISRHHTADVPLVVGGDFNCILAPGEKKGGRPFFYSQAASEMGDFMAANDLIDPGFTGSGLTVSHLSRIASDHCPILCSVQEDGNRRYSRWIKFEDVWATFPKAWQIVSEKWKVNDTGSEATKLNKIKMLNQLKDDLDKEIRILQELECSPTGITEIQSESLRYKVQLLKATLAKITMWWGQRAKVRWIEEGDGNNRFFHSMASARRRSNQIEQLQTSDGLIATKQADILRIVHDFFAQKWNYTPITETG